MVSPARAVFTDTEIACSLWVGFGTSWGWMSSRPAPTSGYCFILLEMEGKLSLPHSPDWSSCLGNTSKMCRAVATPFLPTPRKTQIFTSGAPARAKGLTHCQAAGTQEETPLNLNPPV